MAIEDLKDNDSQNGGKDSIASANVAVPLASNDDESLEEEVSPVGASQSADVQERLRRADALRSAQRALELADQLKLVSLNVAIESAKTRTGSVDLKRIKADLSTLTNQAVKASRDIGGMISAINSGEPIVSEVESDFRQAVKLKKDLESILNQSKRVLESIDRLESH